MTNAPFSPFGAQTYTLASSISSTDTTILLSSFLEPVTEVPYTMDLLNTQIVYGTIAPKTTSSEFISFTGITQNADGTATLTGVTRGLAKKYPFTTDSAYKLPHSGQSQLIISDAPQVFQEYISLNNDETIVGVKTFSSFPITPSAAPTTDYQTANKKYVDDTAVAGAPNATTTVKGIIELATQAETDARTTTGGTGASIVPTPALLRTVLTHDYIASASGTDSYAITCVPTVTAYTTGDIYYFKADVANTGACSLNVNGLGAKTLLVNGTLTPADGYIKIGSLIQCQYDGTNMQILSVNGRAQLSQSGQEIYGASSGGTDTYAITVAPTPISYATGQVYRFKADVANTGAASLNINGLGALSILRADGSALANGDIAANQIVEVCVYDGSNCKMLSPLANAPKFAQGVDNSWTMATASGNLVIAHGLGRTPRKVTLTATIPNSSYTGGGQAVEYGVFDGTNTASFAGTTNILNFTASGASPHNQIATISVDSTNITLAFTLSGTNGSDVIKIVWTAEA